MCQLHVNRIIMTNDKDIKLLLTYRSLIGVAIFVDMSSDDVVWTWLLVNNSFYVKYCVKINFKFLFSFQSTLLVLKLSFL
jgi:hypothetical protein